MEIGENLSNVLMMSVSMLVFLAVIYLTTKNDEK